MTGQNIYGGSVDKLVRMTFVCLLMLALAPPVQADLGGLLHDLNSRAIRDIDDFNRTLSSQFGIPVPQVQDVIKALPSPADAFICLELGRITSLPPAKVVAVYQRKQGQGWGAVARELGIKPGSAEFHALKRGAFSLTGKPEGSTKGQGKAKTKGQGRGKKQ